MLVDLRLPVFLDHGPPKAVLHFLGFASEHRGLISHADRLQVNVRIEALRISAFELFQELLLVAAVQNVVANVIGLGEVINHEVMAGAISGRLRSGRLGLLVPGFAVNDAGDRLLRVLPHAFPHTHHVAAGGVHHQTALLLQLFPGADLRPKGGDDDHVLRTQPGHLLLCRLRWNGADAHVADLIVDLGIVDDFSDQVNRPG